MSIPAWRAALRTVLPAGALIFWPLMVRVDILHRLSLLLFQGYHNLLDLQMIFSAGDPLPFVNLLKDVNLLEPGLQEFKAV